MSKYTYFPYFDYLRIVLASVVMLFHYDIITWGIGAKFAVDVFFALSGWLIGGILLNTQSKDLPKFYFARVTRIWVPYYIALCLLISASLFKDTVDQKWLEFIFFKITWVYNLFGPPQISECINCMPLGGAGNHFWSVNAEEQFYLIAPLIFILVFQFRYRVLVWALLAGLLIAAGAYGAITLGVLAAIFFSRRMEWVIRWEFRLVSLLFCMAAVTGLFFFDNYAVFAPFAAISLVLFLAIPGKKHSLGTLLGGMSYPLYLNHWLGAVFFGAVFKKLNLENQTLENLAAVAMSYTMAAFLFWFIERPILTHRNEFYSHSRGLWCAATSYLLVLMGLAVGLYMHLSWSMLVIAGIFLVSAVVLSVKLTTDQLQLRMAMHNPMR